MNILVTGASGFIGKALAIKLAEHHHHVIASSRNISTIKELTKHKVTCIENLQIDAFISRCDVAIHTAAIAHITSNMSNHHCLELRKINIDLAVDFAKKAIAAKVKRFIFISTVKVMGESTTNQETPFTENYECHPEDDYGKSKFEAENALKDIFKGTNTELVIIRPPLVYGAGVKANFKNLISLCSKPIPLPFGAIHNKRSLIYLENLIDFIELCCSHPKAINQTFLISDDYDVSTAKLARAIKNALKKPAFLLPIPQKCLVNIFNIFDKQSLAIRLCVNLHLDITKAKTLLGWKPLFTFDQGIKKTVDAYLQQTTTK